MTDATELKPCPFCGGEPEWDSPLPSCKKYLLCDNDYCMGPTTDTFNTPREVIKQWNTRAALDNPRVKPLVFTGRPKDELPDGAHLAADCPFGRYFICNRGEYGFGWKRAGSYVFQGFEPTDDAAKAAAQAHHEARVLACLE